MKDAQKPKIRLTWIIHYACNYRCPYCFYYEGAGWEILKDRNIYFSPDQWLEHWKRIYEKYGRCYIAITGGEPFTYPDFIELISKLSKMHYPINISSNSSGDLDSFVKLVSPERISLSLSFHPEFDRLDIFLERVQFLRKNKFDGCINFLAYPPYFKNIEFYINKFESIGEKIKIIPFRGIYKEIAYPVGYAEAERSLIGLGQEWFNKTRKKGAACYAGKQSGLLLPDGEVSRCGQLWYNCTIGNFFNSDFKLLDQPQACPVEMCPCNEDILWGEAP